MDVSFLTAKACCLYVELTHETRTSTVHSYDSTTNQQKNTPTHNKRSAHSGEVIKTHTDLQRAPSSQRPSPAAPPNAETPHLHPNPSTHTSLLQLPWPSVQHRRRCLGYRRCCFRRSWSTTVESDRTRPQGDGEGAEAKEDTRKTCRRTRQRYRSSRACCNTRTKKQSGDGGGEIENDILAGVSEGRMWCVRCDTRSQQNKRQTMIKHVYRYY